MFSGRAETISNMCSDIRLHELKAIYQKSEYSCQAGTFLPADTEGCKICPTGHTCNGGNFVFNTEKSQGIKYNNFATNTEYACSVNMPALLSAVYEPNTITINWDDGTNTTQNTCVYGQSITLPPTPVRPGYKFGGWRVKRKD